MLDYYCCVGVGRCGMCWGTCCPLVNDVLNSLVEIGELDQDVEVSVSVLFSSVCVIVGCPCRCCRFLGEIRKSKDNR